MVVNHVVGRVVNAGDDHVCVCVCERVFTKESSLFREQAEVGQIMGMGDGNLVVFSTWSCRS